MNGYSREHGRQTAVAFNAFCTDVTSLDRMLTAAALLSILAQIAASINTVTEQFIIIVNRHLGLQTSKGGNNNGDGDGDGFTDPDITNPEVPEPPEPGEPGSGTQNPDISNPPPPPFLPDFE